MAEHLIEDLMMLADKCSEDNPADELGLLLVRAVGQIRGDASALAAKDARIVELEGEVRRLDAGWHEANKQALEQKLAATPSEDGGEVKRWALSLYNDCGGYSPKMVDPETLPNPETRTRYVLESDYLECRSVVAAKDAEIARLRELHENAHSAAKTLMAERATLMEQAAHWLEVNAPSGGCIETNIADELRAEAEQLRAQPARQVGGDTDGVRLGIDERTAIVSQEAYSIVLEREQAIRAALAPVASQVGGGEPEAWMCVITETGIREGGSEVYPFREDADRHAAGCHGVSVVPLYRSALAPAAVAVVMPTVDQVMKVVMRYQWEDKANVTGTTNWAANLGMAVVNEVARLNRRAIPVELLESVLIELESGMLCNPDPADIAELRALISQQQEGGV